MAREYRIGVIPGDGTGPEVVAEGIKVLDAASAKFGFTLKYTHYDLGGERYLKTGETLPAAVLADLKSQQAIFLGAIGHPDVPPGILEKQILLQHTLRPRPVYQPAARQALRGRRDAAQGQGAGGHRFRRRAGEHGGSLHRGGRNVLKKGTPDEVAVQESINTRKGVERCIRFAFDLTRRRNKGKKLTLCGKTNVLTYAFNLWERAFYEVAKEYPDIKTDYAHVDATVMWMVKNPEWFDVIVTDNMFGDIITDLGAMVQGGLGIACGGNINPAGVSMFEPIGGSAPKYTGKNVINPIAAIFAAAMMLDYLGETQGALAMDAAVARALKNDVKSVDAGRMGMGTRELGDLIVRYLG